LQAGEYYYNKKRKTCDMKSFSHKFLVLITSDNCNRITVVLFIMLVQSDMEQTDVPGFPTGHDVCSWSAG